MLFAVLLTACPSKPKQLLTASENYYDSVALPLKEGAPYCLRIFDNINYYKSSEPALAQSINDVLKIKLFGEDVSKNTETIPQAAQKFHDILYEDYKTNNVQALEEDEDLEFDFIYNYEYETVGYETYLSDTRLSYCIERYVYLGGAHGINTRQFVNFELPSGKLISEQDVFKGEYREPLHKIMLQQIVEQDDDVALVRDIEEKGYFPQNIYPNDNFFFTDSTIVFVFNPYEIGPYAFGDIEIELPFSLISDYLK